MSADGHTHRVPKVSALALKFEVQERFHEVVRKHDAKTLARAAEASHRTAEKWQRGGLPSMPSFLALARQIPELRKAVLRWLEAERDLDPELDRLTNDLMRAYEALEAARGRKAFGEGGEKG